MVFCRFRPTSINIFQLRQKTLRPKLTQAEGLILGVGAKIFTIAGPVIVYGILASMVYGSIYWITQLL
ncbi:MAG: SpoVA/SpoVAEb family sporulation membrane protein [Clostridia bacterium]|nr:SpoVA/SpoVAEb family sporulation membrane protein [Clostridia bacterium]